VVCLLAPVLVVPLILLLTPLLLPLGFGLTFFGLGRAGLIAALGGAVPVQLLETRSRSETQEDDASEAPSPRCSTPETPPPLVELRSGSLHELNQLAGERTKNLVKQVGQLVRNNLSKVTKEVSGEVEQHLHALQRELQSWAGANPNLKPYCHGHIGWLLRLEARQTGLRLETPQQADALMLDGSSDGGSTGGADDDLRGDADLTNGPGDGKAGTADSPARPALNVRQRPELDLSLVFEDLLEALTPNKALTKESLDAVPLPANLVWSELGFLLVPGLLTKWYPLYMKQLRVDMKRLGLHVAFSRVDTDQPVRLNAARVRHEILEMSQGGRKVILLGHSKGAVDCAAALSLFPELCDIVAGFVSVQGPHGGSAIAHDLSNTNVQKTVLLGALEKLLRGCKHAVLDLSFESRQEFLRQHTFPADRVPTLCVASCDRRQSSLLTPLIEYVAVRYGEVCDGLVCQCDAIMPNCKRVIIDDMDHFVPAWGSFPATDRYDPTRLWLACISLALRFGHVAGADCATEVD
jgi:hypothetical protein